MSFHTFDLHPDLLRGVAALGFDTPTPIQRDAIPAVHAGRDVLACAMTGSGKTAAFLLPILHRLLGRPRGTTRALVIAPTRELAAQIDEHRQELGASHAPHRRRRLRRRGLWAAGAGAPPRRRRARRHPRPPARPLRAVRTRRLAGLEVLVLDEADRMLDMGFLPDIRRVLQHLPARRQTLLLLGDHAAAHRGARPRDPARPRATIAVERPAAPATGITHTAYPVASELQVAACSWTSSRGRASRAACSRSRAPSTGPNRLAEFLGRHGRSRSSGSTATAARPSGRRPWRASRAGSIRCWWRRTSRPAASTSRRSSQVVNFDVPHAARGLHPPRRPDRPGGSPRRCPHPRVAERGRGPPHHRASHRDENHSGDAAGFRLRPAAVRAPGGSARRAYCRDPGPARGPAPRSRAGPPAGGGDASVAARARGRQR